MFQPNSFLNFKTITGKLIQIRRDEICTAFDAKIIISRYLNLNPTSIRLLFKAKILPDNQKMQDLHIQETDKISIFPTKQPKIPQTKEVKVVLSTQTKKFILPPRQNTVENFRTSRRKTSRIIKQLMELGFSEEQCIHALKFSNYNKDRAAYFLTSGLNAEIEIDNELTHLREMISNSLDAQSDKQNEEKPKEKCNILTSEMKHQITQFTNEGYDLFTVLQVFLACGTDAIVTRTCLDSMK